MGKPEVYFPTDVGRTWKYDITLAGGEDFPPLVQRIEYWPMGDVSQINSVRGVLRSFKNSTQCKLIYRVKQKNTEQGPLKYPLGVELL